MAAPIEDYAIVGDMQTAALVSRSGSIDWLCFPRFDSGACFAALLGEADNGHWTVAPRGGSARAARRRYRGDTLVLETEWEVPEGAVRVIDFMPPRHQAPDIVRIVEGISGRVPMRSCLRLRFDYGTVVPWVRKIDQQIAAVAGPDAVWLRSDVPTYGRDFATYSDFEVCANDRVRFVLTWHPSHLPPPTPVDADEELAHTEALWKAWSGQSIYAGPWREAVQRSLLTLKALTYEPTGGIVAAATTSLPEDIGGSRNWDYRYCWLRDATMTLSALIRSGYDEEAAAWRQWLLRAVAGSPADLQIMYGVAGERRLLEYDLPWLSGYEDSRPVRVGNLAVDQLQLDVYGEVIDALALARQAGLDPHEESWSLQAVLISHLSEHWHDHDEGIWEVRGPRRPFTHSKVMAWVAMDRAVRAVEEYGVRGPVGKWRAVRDEIHREVCAKGYDADRNTFTQSFGSRDVDAALLLIPQVGFLPPDDPRVVGTIEAVQRELTRDGLVMRYPSDEGGRRGTDGMPGTEGTFLACTFWLADDLAMIGRTREACDLFCRLLDLRNDVGLLSEEYDPRHRRMVGNFPQAYSHIALINSALHLDGGTPVRSDPNHAASQE
ncbi:Glucoamylase (glucan-1,4-alpha-glucosidase), GH15 family [Actinopolymorpha cephalotaxi]|uniref:Trehalase n=1 Tax=Actinopolymorpha cephalotaxi TaxID=504797 RepID=A0A1I2QZK9_9ACTN|nr:glycoside hydrolase family 15 protein [Actinopolymorpha cephalotaxi]NYH82489.1 GH15 family glucan-1,4-alpha-glucosidase [Actinopolymorpha cephalotaxi]SFG31727.1 Glucoamylase (glucan-1,4-alpha-glucosidase), GH15 family [Actinopolymorpha cephalotaxi]